MTDPLDGPRAKVARARQQLKAFDRQFAAMRKQSAELIKVRRYLDANDKSWVVRLTSVKQIDIGWAVKFGEIAHDLRSALDHMTYALAFIDSRGKPSDRVQFPIVSSPREFNRHLVQDAWLRGLTRDHRRFIARCQPYRVRKGDPNPLALLNDLSNDDKHRVLQPSAFFAGDMSYAIHDPPVGWTDCTRDFGRLMALNYPLNPLKPDTELVRIPLIITGPNPNVQVVVRASLYIAFRNATPCSEGLSAVADRVDAILDESAVEFARPQAQRRWQLPSSRFQPATFDVEFTHDFVPDA